MRKWIYTVSIFILILIIGGCNDIELKEPPSIIVMVDGQELDSARGGYEWSVNRWFSTGTVIADAMAPNQIAEKLKTGKVQQDSVATISFSDGSKPEIKSFLWSEQEEVGELSVSKQSIALPTEKGRHIIEVRGIWPNGEGSYTFVVEVL